MGSMTRLVTEATASKVALLARARLVEFIVCVQVAPPSVDL